MERLFDARVGASATDADKIQIEDQEGRRIKLTQGAGDGTMFGTDETNNGGLLARETMRNNISAEWSGDNLVVTNVAGGKISLSGFSAASNSQVLFDVVDDAQTDGLNYQAVIIDPDPEEIPGIDVTGNILPNKEINVRFTIYGNSGNTEYQEIHTTKTDEYGMINLVIGKGNSVAGKFTEIYWDGSTKNLKVEINLDGTYSHQQIFYFYLY